MILRDSQVAPVSFDDLEDPGRIFEQYDGKIHVAVLKAIGPLLKRKILRVEESMLHRGTTVALRAWPRLKPCVRSLRSYARITLPLHLPELSLYHVQHLFVHRILAAALEAIHMRGLDQLQLAFDVMVQVDLRVVGSSCD